MPISLATLSFVSSRVSMHEGLKILERDDHRCQYCGLDGRASFENALVMRVDFVHPRVRKGKKDPSQSGRLLRSLQHHQRHPGLRQFRRCKILRPQTARNSPQSLGSQNRAPALQTRHRLEHFRISSCSGQESSRFGTRSKG